eukprot:scpid25536/ scgid9146/ Ferredoxin-fold anticodon-binding domain-containing protein 1 homolog
MEELSADRHDNGALQDADLEPSRFCLIVGDGNLSFAAGLAKVCHSAFMRCACHCESSANNSSSPRVPERRTSSMESACSMADVLHTCTAAAASCSTGTCIGEPSHSAPGCRTDAITSDTLCQRCCGARDSYTMSECGVSDRVSPVCELCNDARRTCGETPCCQHSYKWRSEALRHASLPAVWKGIDGFLATCYEQEVDVRKRRNASKHIDMLVELGHRVETGVDGTALHTHTLIGEKRYRRVLFNYPHTGGRRDKIQLDRALLREFFSSASKVLDMRHSPALCRLANRDEVDHRNAGMARIPKLDRNIHSNSEPFSKRNPVTMMHSGSNYRVDKIENVNARCQASSSELPEQMVPACLPQIAVLLMPGQGGTTADEGEMRERANHWQAVEMAAAAGLMLCAVQRVNTDVIPGYARTGLQSRDAEFGSDVGVLHVFTPALRPVQWGRRRYLLPQPQPPCLPSSVASSLPSASSCLSQWDRRHSYLSHASPCLPSASSLTSALCLASALHCSSLTVANSPQCRQAQVAHSRSHSDLYMYSHNASAGGASIGTLHTDYGSG